MVRVSYNDGRVLEYKSINEAQLMIATELFTSNGAVVPEEAVEVMSVAADGVSVERVLNIKMGAVELT